MPDRFESLPALSAGQNTGKELLPRLIILSGPSGVGKSNWCLELVESARARELVVGGLLSLAVFHDDHKVGIDLVDVISGDCRRLAIRRRAAREGIDTAKWVLDPDVLAWGNQRLLRLPACDVVIVDELGPEEMERHGGFWAALRIIEERRFRLIVAVVRPRLLPEAGRRWPWAEVITLSPDPVAVGLK